MLFLILGVLGCQSYCGIDKDAWKDNDSGDTADTAGDEAANGKDDAGCH